MFGVGELRPVFIRQTYELRPHFIYLFISAWQRYPEDTTRRLAESSSLKICFFLLFMVKWIFLDYWLGKNCKLNDLTKANCSISICSSFSNFHLYLYYTFSWVLNFKFSSTNSYCRYKINTFSGPQFTGLQHVNNMSGHNPPIG